MRKLGSGSGHPVFWELQVTTWETNSIFFLNDYQTQGERRIDV